MTEDKEKLFLTLNDEEVKKHIPVLYAKKIENIDTIIDIANSNDVIFFVIEDKQTNELLGIILAYKHFVNTAICTYLIRKEYRGNGIIYYALKMFIKYLYSIKFSKAITFQISADNSSSLRIMEKLNIPFNYFAGINMYYELSLEKEPSF